MHQATVGQLMRARHAFVNGMVDLDILLLPVLTAFPPVTEPEEEDPDGVWRAFADYQTVALNATSLVNQSRGGRPLDSVERGVV